MARFRAGPAFFLNWRAFCRGAGFRARVHNDLKGVKRKRVIERIGGYVVCQVQKQILKMLCSSVVESCCLGRGMNSALKPRVTGAEMSYAHFEPRVTRVVQICTLLCKVAHFCANLHNCLTFTLAEPTDHVGSRKRSFRLTNFITNLENKRGSIDK